MNTKYEEMIEKVIRKFGFEDIHTIIFCGMVDRGCDTESIYDTFDTYMEL